MADKVIAPVLNESNLQVGTTVSVMIIVQDGENPPIRLYASANVVAHGNEGKALEIVSHPKGGLADDKPAE